MRTTTERPGDGVDDEEDRRGRTVEAVATARVGGPADALRRAAPALLAYTVVRVSELAILVTWAVLGGRRPVELLTDRWDSTWYAHIAEHGYGRVLVLDDGRVHSDLAFFPLLPGLEWLGAAVTPLRAAEVGALVSAVASLAAAWAIFEVGSRLTGRRAGIALAALWGVLPTAIVQSMGYTESLFTAVAAWAMYALMTERWLLAGTLALVSGATRPSGTAVIAAVWIAAAVMLWRSRHARARLRTNWRMVLAVILAPLGFLTYVGFVATRTGDLWGYITVQRRWGNGFDGGLSLARFVGELLTGPRPLGVLAGVGVCAALAFVLGLWWLCLRQRQPLPLLVFAGVVVVTSLVGSGYFSSRPRLMMPAFNLLLPLAVIIARWSPAKGAALLGTLAIGSGAYSTTMFGEGPP
ncbi:MAG TPA: hypothetical protein VI076_17185 [Actinopolymorphaceae bacterium]